MGERGCDIPFPNDMRRSQEKESPCWGMRGGYKQHRAIYSPYNLIWIRVAIFAFTTILERLDYWAIVHFLRERTSIRLIDCFNHLLILCFQFFEILFKALNLLVYELAMQCRGIERQVFNHDDS